MARTKPSQQADGRRSRQAKPEPLKPWCATAHVDDGEAAEGRVPGACGAPGPSVGDTRCIVRFADGARFVYTCPDSGRVSRSWGRIDAAAWVQVLHHPRFVDQVMQGGGAWEPAACPVPKAHGAVQLDDEPEGDEAEGEHDDEEEDSFA